MGKSSISVFFACFLPSWNKYSDAKLWYISCFHTGLFVKDRHTPGRRFHVCLRFFACQISCSNLWVDRNFQTNAKTLFETRFRLNSHKISTSSSLWYPNIGTYIVTCSSEMKWIPGFILCTLYSSDHCEFFSL